MEVSAFLVSLILSEQQATEIHGLLYRSASITAKADGTVSDIENRWLGELVKRGGSSLSPVIHDRDAWFEKIAHFIIQNQQSPSSPIQ
ncbi:MAG: hypothetical protein LUF04_02890 [Bacteroides sp.]|nr:hypothetical protein [Bacteroides sp.]